MKIGILQFRSYTGDFEKNSEKILKGYQQAVEKGARLVFTPELFLPGYCARDLFLRSDFIEAHEAALGQLASQIGEIPLILGALSPNLQPSGKPLYNSAVVLLEGKIRERIHKTLLPDYDVFEESRYFECGNGYGVLEVDDKKVGITICEDIWSRHVPRYNQNPLEKLREERIDLLINLSASPWHVGKENIREKLLAHIAQHYKVPIFLANMVGGYDEILFDGQSLGVDTQGRKIEQGKSFEEEILVFDSQAYGEEVRLEETTEQKVFQALCMGTRDYLHRSGFKQVVLGLSGGIDSALTAVIAAKALGSENVLGVAMPSQYSSCGSLTDAEALARTLGIEYKVLPIQSSIDALFEQMKSLFSQELSDLTQQNIQARVRGLTLMAISSQTRRIVLTTGNKSELAVGYCTLYGDMCGGLNLIGDLWKTEVYQLAAWINRKGEVIPQSTMTKAPSAELKPNQRDQDTLPPYSQLDRVLNAYLVEHKSFEQILEIEPDEVLVRQTLAYVQRAEHKRKQAPPILKVSARAFGYGRHYLITNHFIG